MTMIKIFLIISTLFYNLAVAAPSLSADSILRLNPLPSIAEFSINGGEWKACIITPTTRIPRCDISSIVIPGTYTLLMRYTYKGGCDSSGLGPCWAEGYSESDPFLYVWKGVPVQKPTGIKIGIQ